MNQSKRGYRPCIRCEKNRAERFFTSTRARICSTCHKKKRSAASHETRVQVVYGLQAGDYARLLEAQGGVCAICKQPRTKRLDVDHDHATGLVRGLCCARCNRQLLARGLRDNPQIARNAAEYLEDPPAIRHIGKRYHQEDGKK
ncbi:endonuclease VII domain-containing protein [Streptomyces sp. NPDC096198]|uniref:endonuclease VII domain-containing protein n=1 Tax=Streptomyces sp. NPDC096198 TaxID=3366080 RepID=UPI00381A31A8